MQNGIFKLGWEDLGKGVIVAFIAVILSGLQQAVTTHGVDVAAYDWKSILDLAVTAGVSYLGKNLFSDNAGKFLGGFYAKK